MEFDIKSLFEDTSSKDNDIRYEALNKLLEITNHKVDWYNDYYQDISQKLKSKNAFQRSIGMQLLCNLAKSDMDNKTIELLPEILKLLDDDKIMVKRQTIQNIWKISISKKELGLKVVGALTSKFTKCDNEKHYNLIRIDILESLKRINEFDKELCSHTSLEELINSEKDLKYKKQYTSIL